MPHILVVDDEDDIRQLVALILESEGYRVSLAANGEEALDIIDREQFDLVFLDIMMPKMDGWEVCRRIKNNPAAKDIPVIFLSVRSQPLDRVIGLEVAHADEYLTKPFDRLELLERVARLLKSKASPA